ncbi:MAG: hypothetical protein WKG07_03415 [Hymenobacter sp.]
MYGVLEHYDVGEILLADTAGAKRRPVENPAQHRQFGTLQLGV